MCAIFVPPREGRLNTPSGRPEIVVSGSLPDAEHQASEWLLSHNYTVIGQDSLVQIANKTLVWGRQERIILSYLSEDSGKLHIYAKKERFAAEFNPGREDSQTDYLEIQKMLGEMFSSTIK